ncbi:MAG: hypothetical protein J6K18_05195 [Bacilli bacterium]|nr:hypothetical protein [Bacilli bacterium]
MKSTEIISLIVTFIGIFSFATIFTILYGNYASMSIKELKSGKRDIELIDEVVYERQEKVKRRNEIVVTIKNVFFYLTLFIVVPVFIFSLISRFTNNAIMIGDRTVMVVASGSMSYKAETNDYLVTNNLNDQFSKYDIIILEKVDSAAELKVYDTIAFVNDKGTNIIHRIKSIKYDGSYETRGDAVEVSDSYNPVFPDVIGRYTGKKIGGIGMFVLFFQSYAGIITIVSLVYCLLMIDRMSEKINKVQLERIEYLEKALGLLDETEAKAMQAAYSETIYYKGFAYQFKDGEFISKDEIKDSLYLEKSSNTIIKEVTSGDSCVIEEEIIKNDEQGE